MMVRFNFHSGVTFSECGWAGDCSIGVNNSVPCIVMIEIGSMKLILVRNVDCILYCLSLSLLGECCCSWGWGVEEVMR